MVIAVVQAALLLAIADGLKQIKRILIMTQAEAAQQIKDLTAQVAKIGVETGATLQKVKDLEALIASGGDATPEVVQALAELKAQAQATDDLVPDAPPAPTP